MRLIVSDSSCVIDLRKVDLLTDLLGLPFRTIVPEPLFDAELFRLTPAEKTGLIDAGLEVRGLNGDQVAEARIYNNAHAALSLNDCFALVIALCEPDAVLLTGDASLRRAAEARGAECHGVLWVIDQLFDSKLASARRLCNACEHLAADPLVFLPRKALAIRIAALRSAAATSN